MAVRVQSVAKKVNLGESTTMTERVASEKDKKKPKQQKAERKPKEWNKVKTKSEPVASRKCGRYNKSPGLSRNPAQLLMMLSTQKVARVARSAQKTLLYPQRRLSSIRHLQAAFRDPTSPFYIEKGSQGPASPDEQPTTALSAAEEARRYLVDRGFDPASFWEQPISWGDHDAFQHVNNVKYLRFFESSRIRWVMSVGHDIGGPPQAESFLRPQGIAFILKSMEINYRRPVCFPDTLLIASKPVPEPDPKKSRTQFQLFASAYSYEQRAVVADLKSVLTWYDYDKLAKCDPGDENWAPIVARMK